MRKKSIAVIMALVVAIGVLAMTLSGCAKVQAEFSEPNLAEQAEVKRYTDGSGKYIYEAEWSSEVTFNTVVLQEKSDQVKLFKMYKRVGDEWVSFYEQDRIDKYRVCAFEDILTTGLRIELTETLGKTKLNGVEIYNVGKKDRDFRVTDYITFDQLEERYDDIVQYSCIVTDWIVIGAVSLDREAEINVGDVATFESNLNLLKKAIEESTPLRGQKANITVSMGVKQDYNEPEENYNKTTKNWINDNIDKIIESVTTFVKKYDIDGIDYDWEYPRNLSEWSAYSKLVVSTADAIQPLGKTLSVALAPWGCGFSAKAEKKIDYVNLMTYDIADERGDHASIYHSGKRAVEDILRETGFKEEQILLGLSFYGRGTDMNAFAWPSWTNSGEKLGKFGNYIDEYIYTDDNGVEKTCSAYINGFAMNRDKTAYAIASSLGGVMIFRAKCDSGYDYEYSLHRAVEEVMRQRLK